MIAFGKIYCEPTERELSTFGSLLAFKWNECEAVEDQNTAERLICFYELLELFSTSVGKYCLLRDASYRNALRKKYDKIVLGQKQAIVYLFEPYKALFIN